MFEGQEGVFPVAVSPCLGRAALHWDVPRCTGHAASLVFVDNSQEAPLGVVSADKSKEGAGARHSESADPGRPGPPGGGARVKTPTSGCACLAGGLDG